MHRSARLPSEGPYRLCLSTDQLGWQVTSLPSSKWIAPGPTRATWITLITLIILLKPLAGSQ